MDELFDDLGELADELEGTFLISKLKLLNDMYYDANHDENVMQYSAQVFVSLLTEKEKYIVGQLMKLNNERGTGLT